MRRKFRIVNFLFWVVVWAGINTFMEAWSDPVLAVLQGVAPLMIGVFVHIALRDPPPEAV